MNIKSKARLRASYAGRKGHTMKKIIKGKLYDTDTASRVYSDIRGNGFDRIEETLYRKRTGEYFIHGEGGARTRYAEQDGTGAYMWGESVVPLTLKAAQEWAEEHMSADAYQAEFGPASEDAERVTLSISLDAVAAARIRAEAAERGMSVSALIASKF